MGSGKCRWRPRLGRAVFAVWSSVDESVGSQHYLRPSISAYPDFFLGGSGFGVVAVLGFQIISKMLKKSVFCPSCQHDRGIHLFLTILFLSDPGLLSPKSSEFRYFLSTTFSFLYDLGQCDRWFVR